MKYICLFYVSGVVHFQRAPQVLPAGRSAHALPGTPPGATHTQQDLPGLLKGLKALLKWR